MDEAQFKAAQVMARRILERHMVGRHGLVAVHGLAMVVAQWAHSNAAAENESPQVYLDDLFTKAGGYLRQLQQ